MKSDRVAGAYVFLGSPDTDKKETAEALADLLECKKQDRITIAPSGSSLKIDQIRQINAAIGLKPFEAKKRVYIIENAHLLTTEAANSLLKNLEEPPSHAMFILTALGADGMLATIVSRWVSR